jgi:ribonuclease Z
MRRAIWIVSLLVLAGIVGVAVLLRVPAVQDRLVERVLERNLRSRADFLLEDDALRVLLCGSSSPFPHPSREKTCVAIFAGGRFYIVDTGPGSWNNLALWRVPADRIGGILLTHFHSDHIGELGEFNLQTWVAGRAGPLAVYGPPGVERVVAGFNEAYALDREYRTAHHGADFMPSDVGRMRAVRIPVGAGVAHAALALREGDLEVTAVLVDHAPIRPAVAYRFRYRGRSVVVSGDTVKLPELIDAARDADVLVHEAQAQHLVATARQVAERIGRERPARILADIPDYHTSPVEAAEVANEAGVGLLVMYHLTPPPPNAIAERVFMRGVDAVRPEGVVLADDGLLVELPLGSSEILTRSLD